MFLILTAMIVLCASGVVSLWYGKTPGHANAVGPAGTVLGCLIGLIPAVEVLWTGQAEAFRMAWQVPFGSFHIQLDALSAFFLLPVLGLPAIAAIYGKAYLAAYSGKKNLGVSWFFYTILTASMMLVVVARNAVLFLMAWEIMSVSSFFLVCFEDEKESVRKAGWTYLVATHIGTAFLLVMFVLLAHHGPSMDFDHFSAAGMNGVSVSGLIFLLAIIGFGTKAGFMPFHVWLPEAHPAAPSHVSAVMSGVMIKTGIYGIVRILTFLGHPDPWWGWVLTGIGVVSGILGVLFALAQHDLKRLLAYHSVENIGIIALGLGMGVLGMALNQPLLAVLGFAGGLLHVLNHAIFKGLLFLGAGAVLHETGERDIEKLGGLMRRMPWTGALFLLGAVAICGLPPLNGFVSEFIIYVAAFSGMGLSGTSLSSIAIITALAMIGGLAAACFTKAFGVVFLGEPRTSAVMQAHEVSPAMRFSMVLLGIGCVLIGFSGPAVISAMKPVVETVTGYQGYDVAAHLAVSLPPLKHISAAAGILLAILGVLIWLRQRLLSHRNVAQGGTWDCGYTRPNARMQYTASSFAQPLTSMFGFFLQTRQEAALPEGFFPSQSRLHTNTEDIFTRNLYRPIFRCIERFLLWLHWMQQGQVQIYILYVAVTLLLLLIWNLR
jgi:formate hydrogenlyase subunit 3/multisubunit Na+/H+ antiporter MnhD subunit